MIRNKLTNLKNIIAKSLIFAVCLLLLAGIFMAGTTTVRIINAVSIVCVAFIGNLLIKEFKKEKAEIKKLEKITKELEIANRALEHVDKNESEFVSIISHQLKTPLTAIKGYVSMMREGDYGALSNEQSSTLEKISQAAERLISLVENFLDLSSMETGQIRYQFKAVDLAEMVDEVVSDLKILAEQKGLKLNWIKPHGFPMAWADPDKIRQVLINFVDNSIKYTEKGTIGAVLKFENNLLVFSLKDTGIGMEPEKIPNLFKKFVRGENSQTFNTGGIGLGLYLAKLITETHGGEINGFSEGRGKGSVFTIKIPTEDYAKRNKINQEIWPQTPLMG